MSAERVVYSIQRTYILKPVSKSEKRILTCDQRIDIPTIEPLPSVKPAFYDDQPLTVIPCIELAGEFLSDFNMTFETNEGVTVLPIKIASGQDDPLENPYTHFRYVLVLPRGATGVKSCKIIHKDSGKEVQHNFTFGIMPPPYNYDNALFGYLSYGIDENSSRISGLEDKVNTLSVTTKTQAFTSIDLPKGAGIQTINLEKDVLFYDTWFKYPPASEPITHNPKITLTADDNYFVYTLSLDKTANTVLIDLLTGRITVYDSFTREIIQESMLGPSYKGFKTLSFENFDDINTSFLSVGRRGGLVK